MGANYFSDEHVKELEKNPYVKKVSVKNITYSEEFKELFWTDLQKGMLPRNILLNRKLYPSDDCKLYYPI